MTNGSSTLVQNTCTSGHVCFIQECTKLTNLMHGPSNEVASRQFKEPLEANGQAV